MAAKADQGASRPGGVDEEVLIPVGRAAIAGSFVVPPDARGVVLFAHGSGSGRWSPRNRFVASALRSAGLGTLLLDLLTEREEEIDERTAELRFNIGFLATRLLGATEWLASSPEAAGLRLGYFGASTGAAAALIAAAERPDLVHAIVSRGGRPDLALPVLANVRAPTLLIVGGRDFQVIEMNREAFAELGAEKRIEIVPGATHLFEEPGALDQVARLASDWFVRYLSPARAERAAS